MTNAAIPAHAVPSPPLLPADYVGAWERDGITIGEGPPSEPQRVVWLQTPLFFADIREPLVAGAEARSFSGTTSLSPGPRLTWHADLDLHALARPEAPSADSGMVHLDGDLLIETGTATVYGAPVGYVERWRRRSSDRSACLSLRLDAAVAGGGSRLVARIVVVGDLAITTDGGHDGHVAALWRREAGAWSLDVLWPPRASPPQAPPADTDLVTGQHVVLDAVGAVTPTDVTGALLRPDVAASGAWLVEGAWP